MIELQGISASPGLAAGRVHLFRSLRPDAPYIARSPSEETSRLRKAMALAVAQLNEIIARTDTAAGAILEFQVELLGDRSFTAPAFNAIGVGKDALQSWTEALEREIMDYRSGSDDYLSARADDIADLRDRVLRALLSESSAHHTSRLDGADILLVADQLAPSRFLELDLSGVRGIATIKGSPTSHVAILARARGIPMIVGCGEGLSRVQDGMDALLDADKGVLAHTANAEDTSKFVRRIEERAELLRHAADGVRLPAKTADGQHVRILANLDSIDLLDQLDVQAFDGVGLVRTEFLFQDGAFPNEQDQYAAYSRILDWASGRPVTVRLLDVGGDKPIQGLTVDGEENPFLGIRGIRLMRHRPEIFRTQLRALARAAAHGDLKVMVPMVAIPAEMAEIRSEMRNQVEALRKAGQDCRTPPMGMMVEVPSAALMAAEFDTDFYSIGTNDLIQYTLAAARDDYRLSYLSRDDISAVLVLIERVVATGLANNRETSVCGDMASDPAMVDHLLRTQIRCLSVAPASAAIVKHTIRNWPRMEQDR